MKKEMMQIGESMVFTDLYKKHGRRYIYFPMHVPDEAISAMKKFLIVRRPSFRLTFAEKQLADKEMRARGVDKVILCANLLETDVRFCMSTSNPSPLRQISIEGAGAGYKTRKVSIDAVAEARLDSNGVPLESDVAEEVEAKANAAHEEAMAKEATGIATEAAVTRAAAKKKDEAKANAAQEETMAKEAAKIATKRAAANPPARSMGFKVGDTQHANAPPLSRR